jgi:hypothetical protein
MSLKGGENETCSSKKNTSKLENQNEGPGRKTLNMKLGRIVSGLTLALVLIAIIGYGFLQCKSFYNRVQSSWDEINFAYQKPNLVKAMRVQYETRQEKLEAEFTRQEKSSQDKLIDEVAAKLQEDTVTPTSAPSLWKKILEPDYPRGDTDSVARVLGMATEMVKAESWKDEMRITFKYEFGDEQWPMVEQLINGESGWNPYAINKSSGACGLFQSLPCSKVLSVAGNLDNIDGQVRWGVDYIPGCMEHLPMPMKSA